MKLLSLGLMSKRVTQNLLTGNMCSPVNIRQNLQADNLMLSSKYLQLLAGHLSKFIHLFKTRVCLTWIY